MRYYKGIQKDASLIEYTIEYLAILGTNIVILSSSYTYNLRQPLALSSQDVDSKNLKVLYKERKSNQLAYSLLIDP